MEIISNDKEHGTRGTEMIVHQSFWSQASNFTRIVKSKYMYIPLKTLQQIITIEQLWQTVAPRADNGW